MPHKITLTENKCVCQKGLLHFRYGGEGSPAAPKGLPKSSAITYTVFANQKQLKKAGLTEENIQTQKVMVQGEPTLDVPIGLTPEAPMNRNKKSKSYYTLDWQGKLKRAWTPSQKEKSRR